MQNQSEIHTYPMTLEGVEKWRSAGTLIPLCGRNIFVVDEGDKSLPVILLIHGFPTSSFDWQGIWDRLRESYRLVTLDMLGFGFSDKPNERTYTIHGQADIFEAAIKALGLTEYHVLAHDYGDTVAQELLARQLEGTGAGQWLSGCFLNGGLFPETHRALLTQKLLLSPLGPLINRFNGFSSFKKNFSHVFGPNTKPSELELEIFWSIINENDGKHLFHNLITYIRDRRQHRERWVEALQQSKVPLALINGSKDPVSGEHMVVRYQQLNCRLDYLGELSEIGHYPQVEAPEPVADHFMTFLQQVSAS